MKNIKFYPYVNELVVNQWFKNGDHPDDRTINKLNEGRVVGKIKSQKTLSNDKPCPLCRYLPKDHGLLKKAIDKNILVCPGDYIETIKEAKGNKYRLHKKKNFEKYFTRNPLNED